MKIELAQHHLKLVKEILSKHIPGMEVWVFGSRVTGTSKKFSDLDLVIITKKPLPSKVMTSLQETFSESNLPIKVDLVDWSIISEDFRKIISQKFQVLIRN